MNAEGMRDIWPSANTPTRRMILCPHTDIIERSEGIFIYCNMPGVTESSLELSMDASTLSIEGQSAFPELPQGRIHALEFDEMLFSAQFTLPRNIDQEKIKAVLCDGVLELFLPYPVKNPPRRIPVISR